MVNLGYYISLDGKKGFLRVMIAGKQWMLLQDEKDKLFCDHCHKSRILKRLVGDFMVALLGVEEVVLVVYSASG
jgi:hypothetical protein